MKYKNLLDSLILDNKEKSAVLYKAKRRKSAYLEETSIIPPRKITLNLQKQELKESLTKKQADIENLKVKSLEYTQVIKSLQFSIVFCIIKIIVKKLCYFL